MPSPMYEIAYNILEYSKSIFRYFIRVFPIHYLLLYFIWYLISIDEDYYKISKLDCHKIRLFEYLLAISIEF